MSHFYSIISCFPSILLRYLISVEFILDLRLSENVHESLLYIIVSFDSFYTAPILTLFGISHLPEKELFTILYSLHFIPAFQSVSISIAQFSSIVVPRYLKRFACPIICPFNLIFLYLIILLYYFVFRIHLLSC